MSDRVPAVPCEVLLVEDDDDQAVLLVRWLESAGRYTVTRASDGIEAETLIRSRDWDLLISDIELPGISGLALARTSKDVLPYSQTLLITAHGSLDYAVEAIRGGVDDFLLKPLTKQPFLEKVAELADRGVSERLKHQHVVLAIGAHPDDVEIGCGGILARHRARGDDVYVLTLSGGEHGGKPGERMAEAQEAAAVLGATLFLQSLPDTAISEGMETIALIEARIREVTPTIIYTHSLQDGHQDHRSVNRATVVAARGVANLYCYQAPSSSIDFRPTKFLEIGAFIDTKVQAIAAYQSQVVKRPYLRESLLRATAEYWGRFAGYGLVEPLEVGRESA
jgi:LmbE family N-acetylglucosaminyl deacetylase/CheY-like chemotaxis protein